MKKRVLSVILTALLVGGLTACGGQTSSSAPAQESAAQSAEVQDAANNDSAEAESEELYHLKIAYSPSLCQAPLHVAVELGFFEAEGIDAENIQVDASHVQEAIGAGQVDVGFGLIGKFLQPIENGLPIQFTAGIHTGCIKILVPADSGIESIEDLRGKRIGVSGLAGAETLIAKRALSAAGISVSEVDGEVEFVVFSKTDLGQALENGAVDVIALGDPTATQFEQEYGLNVLVDTTTTEPFADEYCCGAFVSNDLAENHPDIAAAFTRAVLKASVWVNEHPREAAQLQLDNNYVTGDIELNTSLLEHYNYQPSVQGGYDAILLSVGQLAEIGVLKEDTDAQVFTDNIFTFFDDVEDTYSAEEAQAPRQ